MRWLSRLTTLAVVVVVISGAALCVRSKMPTTKVGQSFVTFAKFRDGSRLAVGSPVVIAGVRIGDITRISIEGRFARVDMRLQDDVQVPVSSFVTRRADSLFGDSYVEVILTGGDEGAPASRMLRSGEPLVNVIEGSSTDTVLRAIDRAMPKIDNALGTLHEVAANGRKFINGSAVASMEEADLWLAAGNVERPIEKAHAAMVRVDDLTTRGADALAGTAPEVLSTLARIDTGVAKARTSIRDAKAGLLTAMRDTREGLDGIDKPLADATEIMASINNGEGDDYKGQLGRLVNDPELADQLEDATDAGREAVSSFYRFKSWLGMRVELNVFSRIPRFYAIAEIRARTDKFYLIEFERGSLGGVPRDQISDVSGSSVYVRNQEIRDTLRFTAQFGKQIGRLAIRAGIKDSTFGAGVDVLMMKGRLKVSTDVFGSFDPTPRLKMGAAFAVFRSIYIIAGVDDVLNEPGYLRINSGINQDTPDQLVEVRYGRDWFVGASLHFDDADLATMLRVYGAALATALVVN